MWRPGQEQLHCIQSTSKNQFAYSTYNGPNQKQKSTIYPKNDYLQYNLEEQNDKDQMCVNVECSYICRSGL